MATIIKQIQTSAGNHDIDAKYWGGHEFSEITDLVHGVVNTYVIPAQTTNKTDGYKAIVESSSAQVTTTATILGALTGTPDNEWDKFGVGDIVLMGATSDGSNNFDRWISFIDKNGNIKLDVLETQVATHHHTLSVDGDTKALTDVAGTTFTALAKAGSDTTVVTGVKGNYGVLTSVAFSCSGTHDIELVTCSASDDGNVSHSHIVTVPTYDSYVDAYTTLISDTYTPHTHTTTSVAGLTKDVSDITYVTSAKTTQSFVTGISINSATTGYGYNDNDETLTATGAVATTTSNVTTGVLTTSSGAHTHGVTVGTGGKVVTSVSLAAKVVTSVSYSAPTESTVTSWECSVNSSGVLSFTTTTSDRVTSVTLNAPRTNQSTVKDSTITLSGTAESAGAHRHGFSHTHSIKNHTHSYDKSTAIGLAKGITSLSTNSFSYHSHNNGVKAYTGTSDSTTITYLKGDASSVTKTSVLTTNKTSVSIGTTPAYLKLEGDVNFTPSLTTSCVSLSTMLSTSSIKPAVTAASTEQGIKSITFNSANFISSLDSVTTGENIGGTPS